MMSRRSGAALAATVAAGLVGSPVEAEDAAPASAPWQLSLTPYVWALSVKGDVGVGRTEADVDVSFSDILDDLNIAVMLEAGAAQGPVRPPVRHDLREPGRQRGHPARPGQDQSDRQYADPGPRRDLPARDVAARRFRPGGAIVGHGRPLCRHPLHLSRHGAEGPPRPPRPGRRRAADHRGRQALGRPDRRPAHGLDPG